jgi:hypothetical protein
MLALLHDKATSSKIYNRQVKVKFTLEQATKVQWGSRRIDLLFLLTSPLDGVGGHHAPAALPSGMTRYPLYRRVGGPQGQYGQVQKILLPPGCDPRNVQPVASHYTDYAIPTHIQ